MTGWTAIVPVKPWGLAKSRLDLPDADRQRLAQAFSLDVLDVVTASSSVDLVIVVTAQADFGAAARRKGALVVVDRPLLDRDGLNRAIASGCHWAQRKAPSRPVAVLPGDLAALDVEALDRSLSLLATQQRAFVPDLSGTGTTLLTASRPGDLAPCFGDGSASLHMAAGYWPVPDVDHRCRLDVDTAADLTRARALGVGSNTAMALRRIEGSAGIGRYLAATG